MNTVVRLSALAVAVVLASACSTEGDRSAASAEPVSPAAAPATGASTAGAAGQPATATGTVTAIDPDAGTITIEHGPVLLLEWPAMTMGFAATPEQISRIGIGQRVRFTFVMRGNKATITGIEPVE